MSTVVLVSGGAAVSPFTTPEMAARSGLAAGNSLTALREALLGHGIRVFTAPARIGAGTVSEDSGWEGFSDLPYVLPAELTIDAVGPIDEAGAALHRFVRYLAAEHGVEDLVLVGHSMGGLFSRAAIHRLLGSPGDARVRALMTIGTPWTGSLLGDHLSGSITMDDAHGDELTMRILTDSASFAHENSRGAAEQVSIDFLAGPQGWNARHTGDLDGIPVTVIAGDGVATHRSPSSLWPHDGLVSTRSASARDVPADVLPHAERHVFPDVHSIFFADALGLPWERGLTWDPDVLAAVSAAVGADLG